MSGQLHPEDIHDYADMAHNTEDMPDAYLPSEILLQILSYVPEHSSSQPTLHSCCLVSRQWNRAATPYLYSSPRLTFNNFHKFADTICPPVSARRRKTELGKLVRRLDMTMLQYHSTNSLTARLLGRVRESLEVFYAPPKSLSLSSLLPLSKCHRLTHLDLSLVVEHLTVSTLSSTFAQLASLKTLQISRSISRDIRENCHLPPNLVQLETSGSPPYSATATPAFIWPASLTTLGIIGCESLSPDVWPQYARLTRLYLDDCFYSPRKRILNAIIAQLTNLVFLSAPGRSFDHWSFTFPAAPSPLRIIEMGRSISSVPSFSLDEFEDALSRPLTNLRVLRVHSGLCGEKAFVRDLDLAEMLLVKHAEEAGETPAAEDEIGVVFFD